MKTATELAQQIADQELEACVEWLPSDLTIDGESLRATRRPKPPSLAEEALAELEVLSNYAHDLLSNYAHDLDRSESAIRRALERLQELEGGK
jgi:hypothetical protein